MIIDNRAKWLLARYQRGQTLDEAEIANICRKLESHYECCQCTGRVRWVSKARPEFRLSPKILRAYVVTGMAPS